MSTIPDDFVPCPVFDGMFANLVGPLFVRRDDGGLTFGFQAQPRHGNERGAVHGGMLMTLADQVLGLTVLDAIGNLPAATISLNNDFVAGASTEDWIEGRAEVTRKTKSIVFVRGTLANRHGIVLNASGLWKVLGAAKVAGEERAP